MAVAPRLISCSSWRDLRDALHLFADGRAPAVELGAERHRHRVLQMRAPHLEHALEFLALGEERILQPAQRLDVARQPHDQREPQRRRIDVVGRLAEIYVIVRIDVLVLALRWPRYSSARLAITSLAFMLVDVPAPPWMKSVMN